MKKSLLLINLKKSLSLTCNSKKYLLLPLFAIVMQCARAQTAYLGFDRIDVQTGLPENLVQDIFQDSEGYMWFTTQNGMVRYDGYNVKIYKPGSEDKSNLTFSFNKIVQDKNHDLWVCGVNTGLFKYDRSADRFVQYKNKALTEKGVLQLMGIDAAGKIWIGTIKDASGYDALVQFDPVKAAFKTYGPGQKGGRRLNFKIFDIWFGHRGEMWLKTNNGCYLYNPATDGFTGYLTSVDPLQQKKINMLYQPPSTPDKLWVAAEDKKEKHSYLLLVDLKSGQTQRFQHLPGDHASLGNDTVNTAFEDGRRRLWMGTNSGLSLYNAATHGFTNYQQADNMKNPYKNRISNIIAGKDGLLWLATGSAEQQTGSGLLCFNPQTGIFKRYAHDPDDPNSLVNNNITDMVFDRSGALWLSLYYNGVAHVNPAKSALTAFKTTKGKFPWQSITYVSEAPDKTWWVSARNGLYHYDPAKQTTKLIDNSSAYFPYMASDGLVYYSFFDPLKRQQGLRVYDPKTGKTVQYQPNPKDSATLSVNNIICILEDHTGIVWLGTYHGGICSFNPVTKKFKRYPYIDNDNTKVSHNMLDDKTVETIYEDKAGTVWVGTNNGGVNHYDRSKDIFISGFNTADGVVCVDGFDQDRTGRLWGGSYLNGLFLLDDRTGTPLKRFTQKDGLLIDQSERHGIHKGSGDFIWISSVRGFSRINTRDFSIKNYKREDNNWTIIPPLMNEQSTDRDGNIILWNGGDFALFNPNALNTDANPPLVHIETMAYSDPRASKDTSVTIQRYSQTKKELPWNLDKITFNYVALHYTDAAENKYAYKLEGYDNHWVQAGTQRSVTYTNLAPGTYTFHVKAANSDGVWNNKGDSIILVINPPWWKTWWAWALYVVLFAWALYAFITYRSHKLLRDKKVLEHKVHVRTEEVIQQKEEIEAQRDNLERAFDELQTTQNQLIQSEKMASLGELTAGIAHEIQNPLNFVNNFSEVSIELLDELKDEEEKGNKKDVIAIAGDLKQNLEKIRHHGQRADAIVKGMLQHSRTSSGQKELTDLNALADEYLRLAYHGLRAKNKEFNAGLVTNFDKKLPKVNTIPQDIGRVLLNIINNAFYAVQQKAKTAGADYKPTVELSTMQQNGYVIISVKDNGNGIPEAIKDKIMQPFFTTKPTGEGTGLGLSLSYDIVVKGHGGSISVDTKEGEFTEFTVMLPI